MRKRQVKKNLKKYGKETRGKSKRNVHSFATAKSARVLTPSGTPLPLDYLNPVPKVPAGVVKGPAGAGQILF